MRKIFIFLSFFILILTFSSCNKTPSETISPTITQGETSEPTTENIPTVEDTPTLEQTPTVEDTQTNENTPTVEETPNITTENEIDFSNTTLAFLGDSITYGYVTKQGGQYANPWPKLVGETLEAKDSINYGKGGTTIAKVEDKTDSFVERYITMDNNLDVIGIMGGTNDWANNVPLGTIDDNVETTIYGALNLIAYGLKEKYPNAYIFFMSPIPRKETWANSQGYKMKDVRDAILNVANLYGFGFLDMYYLSGFENEMKLDTTDGVHPSQELIATSFAPQIAQFIKENYKINDIPTTEDTPTVEETPNIPTENEIDFSELTYVAMGDSITHGTYLETPYPYLVGDILGIEKVYNYGINSSTISKCNDGRDSLHNPMVLRYMNMNNNADIISVMAGINDWIHFHDFGTIDSEENTTLYGALKIMCQGLKEKYPNSFIFFMTPYDSSVEKEREETPKLVGEIIKEVCAIYDIPVLDLYARNDFIPSKHSSDGLHPNQEFMNTYTAPTIAQFIKENYKINDIPTTEDTPTVEETPNIPTENVIDFSNLIYTACGDSITANGNPSYCEIVCDSLDLKSYNNCGIAGTTMSNCNGHGIPMVKRIDNVDINSDIITIMFGTNDCSFGCGLGNINSTSENNFYGAYKIVINALKTRCPNAKIILMTPLQNIDYNSSNEETKVNSCGYHLIDYVNAIKELANCYNLPCLDLYNLSGINIDTLSIYTSDGVHPTQEFHKNILAPLIAEFIKDNYKENNNSTIPNNEYMHISFDDVSTCFNNLTTNNYNSLFDEPFFNKLLFLHNEYDAKFSLYTYNTVLNNVPDKYKNDFTNSSDWLKIGFHSNSSGLNLSNTTYEQGFEYWNSFVNNVIRICGSADSIDRMPRLEFFSGSLEALLGMKNASYGALGFLSADDNRLSYYFNNDMMNHLYDNNYLIDEENNLTFISTDIRCDWFYNFSSNNNYKAPIKDNVYDELTYRYTNSELKSSFRNMIIFTHEWLVYNGQTINSKFDSIIDACRFAEEYNIKFNYAQNITYTD